MNLGCMWAPLTQLEICTHHLYIHIYSISNGEPEQSLVYL